MFLFFDTETTGLSRATDRIVQIAWVITDPDGRVCCEESHIIKPDGYEIPSVASGIHGITTQIAMRSGRERHHVLSKFVSDAKQIDYLVAHNISFDLGMVRGDLRRSELSCGLDQKHHICTMKLSTAWCQLPKFNGGAGYKWPKLEELHHRLFGSSFENAHDALSDVHATRRCFFELLMKKIIVIPEPSSSRPQNGMHSNMHPQPLSDHSSHGKSVQALTPLTPVEVLSEQAFVTPDRARKLAEEALRFKRQRGRLPDISSPDIWEKRLAEGVAAFARFRARNSGP